MSLPIVVFDIDDTLWPLTDRVTDVLNLPRGILTEYYAKNNTHLPDSMIDNVLKCYANPEIFTNINWFDGVERINEMNADKYVCSNCLSEAVIRQKRIEIPEKLIITDSKILLHLINDTGAKDKELPDNMFILFDDSPYNVAKSTAQHNIVVRRAHNVTHRAYQIMHKNGFKNVYMVDTLNEGLDIAFRLLEEANSK